MPTCTDCYGEHGDNCESCDHGRAFCAECTRDGYSEIAVESLDFSDEGGPRDWPVCASHARDLKARRQQRALREEI